MLKKEKAEVRTFSLTGGHRSPNEIGWGYLKNHRDVSPQLIATQEIIADLSKFFWGICESCNSAFTLSEKSRDSFIWLCENCLSRQGGDSYEN